MNPTIINAFDLNGCWYEVLKACIEEGYERPVFRGARKTQKRKELDFAFLNIKMPSNRPLIPDVPEGVPPPTDMKYVNKYLEYLITPFKTKWEDYTYGERIASQIKIDMVEGQRVSSLDFNQLEKIREFLRETPETNRSIIVVGRPEDLLLEHPPCMRTLHFKVRYNKLHMFGYFRSWDAWGGLPSNLAALQLLKEFLGRELNVNDGEIFLSSFGLHIYSGEWELAKKVIGRK